MKECKRCKAKFDDKLRYCPVCSTDSYLTQKKCPNCGAPVSETARFCAKCGHDTESGNICSACGSKNIDGAAFCAFCGNKMSGQPAAPTAPTMPTTPRPASTRPQSQRSAYSSPDPFAAPVNDPFAKPVNDPLAKPVNDPFAAATSDPFVPSTSAQRADPFAPQTAQQVDPFAPQTAQQVDPFASDTTATTQGQADICPNCKKAVKPNSLYCGNCGQQLAKINYTAPIVFSVLFAVLSVAAMVILFVTPIISSPMLHPSITVASLFSSLQYGLSARLILYAVLYLGLSVILLLRSAYIFSNIRRMDNHYAKSLLAFSIIYLVFSIIFAIAMSGFFRQVYITYASSTANLVVAILTLILSIVFVVYTNKVSHKVPPQTSRGLTRSVFSNGVGVGISVLLCAILVIVPTAVNIAQVFDNQEPFDNATPLTVGTTGITMKRESDGKVYYSFTPTVTGEYTISSSGSYDPMVWLYDSNGNSIASNDDGGSNSNFSLTYDLTADTTYYYAFALYSDESVSSATVSVTLTAPVVTPGGSSIEKALALSTGTTNISMNTSKIYYSFTPTVTGSHTISSSGSYDTMVWLYDANGNVIASNDDNSSSRNFSLSYNLTADTTYYYAFAFVSGTSATVSVTLTAPVSTPDGSSIERALELSTGTTSISMTSDFIYYSFTPTDTGEYTISSSGSYDTMVYLYNSNGSSIASNNDGGSGNNFSLTYNLTADTTYYYAFTLVWGSSATVSVTLTAPVVTPDGSSFDRALELSTGTTSITMKRESTAKIYYSFTPTVTGSHTISSSGSRDTKVWLYDTSHELLEDHDDISPGSNKNFSLTYNLTAGTKYYYAFSLYTNESVSSATVSVTLTAPVVTPDGSSIEKALELSTGTTNIAMKKQSYIYYSFTPTVTGSHTISSSGSRDTKVWLYDSNGNSITSNDDVGGGNYNFSLSRNLTAGTTYYYAFALHSGESVSSATVSVTLTAPVLTPDGSSFDRALELSTGTTNIAMKRDTTAKIYYSFTPTVTGSYTISSSGSYDPKVWLYASDGSSITSDDDGGGVNNFSLTYNLTADTKYYYAFALVSGSSATVSVTLTAPPDGSSFDRALELSAGTTSISMNTSKIYYSFTPTVTGSHTISSSGSYDPKVYLYDSNGNSIANDDDISDSNRNFSLTRDLTAGTKYYYAFALATGSSATVSVTLTAPVLTPDGSSFERALPLSTGTTSITMERESTAKIYYSFTPTVTGSYTISSSGSYDPKVWLYHFNGNSIANNDDTSESNKNFSLTYNLAAGITYYYAFALYSSGTANSATVSVTLSRN